MLRWYAIRTKTAAEKQVARGIAEQSFPICFPLCSFERKHARKRRTVTAPLFPRYLFAQFDREDDRWKAIAYTRGVAKILPHNDDPLPVRAGVVEEIVAAIASSTDGSIRIEKPIIEPFKPNESVHFVSGSWLGIKAIVRLDEGERVRVLLDMLGSPRVIPVLRESLARG